MDDVTLQALKTALAQSPQNLALVGVLLKAHLDRKEPREAAALLEGHAPEALDPAAQKLAARALLELGEFARARAYALGDAPEALILRARADLGLGRAEEARRGYERALAENPALEDPELAAALAARPRAVASGPQDGRPRFHVIDGGDADPELARLVVPEKERVTFDQVGGLDEVKAQIKKRIVLPFQKPSLFQKFKKQSGGGVLLYGPPGCGKTLLARATAGECKATFFNIAIADVLDMYIGESEAKLHALFEKARSSRPAVLFFDEVEALGAKRQHSRDNHTAKLVSQFLAEMDGFEQKNDGVLILGATNVPWALDPAFRRPGRFDRFFLVPPPDRKAREEILALHLRGRPVEEKVDLAFLAEHTSSFSGADLLGLVEEAADAALEATLSAGREVPIQDAHLKAALKSVKPTTLEWFSSARNHARYANEGGQYDEVLEFLKRHGK